MKTLSKQEIGIVTAFILSILFVCVMNYSATDRFVTNETDSVEEEMTIHIEHEMQYASR
ncbi:hypothetical protein [Bacillus alkalicellulosilyticus]|uniref:hypothetical protein n=1 Tax=Alkalihalobacterium alkalicellulosilyticum TaxID=1912214 RepID=UPI001483C4AB|nr:hypothetical protein [Bacillus alkalicellulosilyticus]